MRRAPLVAALALGLGAVLAVAAGGAREAWQATARVEARLAAALWEAGGAEAVAALLGERATVADPDAAGVAAGAYAYEAGALEPATWIAVQPRRGGRAPLDALLTWAGGALLGAWALRRRGRPGTPRYPAGVAILATGCVAAAAFATGRWLAGEYAALNSAAAAQRARAADIALAAGGDAGGLGVAARAGIAESPWLPLAAAAGLGIVLVLLALYLDQLRPRILRRALTAWGLLAPAAALMLAFTFGPLLFSLWISLHEWRLIDPQPRFLGLDNYAGLLSSEEWWRSVRNTALFSLHVPFAMAVALALALLTQGSRQALRWARLALFLPGITSVAAIAVVWKWLLSDQYGLVNRVLEGVGIGAVPWLTSPEAALVSLMVIGAWMVVGYQMVVLQAGLAAIPRDWYDAARVDGAGPWRRLRHVTLPGLRHTLFFVLVTSVIGSFQVFTLVYVMTEGGPLGATDLAVYRIYREAWEFLQFGNAAAMSWLLFIIIFAATWLHFRFLERGSHG